MDRSSATDPDEVFVTLACVDDDDVLSASSNIFDMER